MTTFRKFAGLIAALVVVGFGALLVPTAPAVGYVVAAGGVGIAGWQGWRLWSRRRDPYDLSRLWETGPEPPEEADEDAVEDEGTLYCHACGHAVPQPLRVCPECGRELG